MTTEDLCKAGLRCCVSSDAFGDKVPPNLIIPNKTKHNLTRNEVRNTPKPTTTSTTESFIKTTLNHLPPATKVGGTQPPNHKCAGECVSGLFALFCDDIDSEADCPDEGSCCITNPVNIVSLPTRSGNAKGEYRRICSPQVKSPDRRCHRRQQPQRWRLHVPL